MSKKREYIINKMHISPIIADEVMEFCKQNGSYKYAVWIAREVSKCQDFEYDSLKKILDWAYSTKPNILSLSYEEAQIQSNNWHEFLEKNSYKEFAKKLSLDEKRIVYRSLDNKHFFYLLIPSELKYEGQYMGHCIGSSSFYANRLRKNQIQLLSLRDENNLPHVTIEMILQTDGLLRTGQISGKGNKEPISKYQNIITEYGLFLISQRENQDFNKLMSLMNL